MSSLKDRLVHVRRLLLRLTEELTWLPPLLARLTTGLVFATSGWGKIHNLEKVTGFFTDLGIPFPAEQAVFVSCVELVGGTLLLLGLLSRVASIPLMGTMVVAILTAKREEITGFVDLVGLVEWAYLMLLIAIAIHGPGAASVDHVLARRFLAQVPRMTRSPQA